MACNVIAEVSAWAERTMPAIDWVKNWAVAVTSFSLVAAAEVGDKSQWVCMALAARHRHWPVLLGAVAAFALLNGIAVAFGAAAGHWLPERAVAGAVAVLFAGFGIRSLRVREDADDETVEEKSGHGIIATTFLMIFLAEFGDKTQIAVAGLGAAESAVPVWLGATLALASTSALGIWAGRTLLQKISRRTLHRVGGILFIGFALFAASKAVPPELWSEWVLFLEERGSGN